MSTNAQDKNDGGARRNDANLTADSAATSGPAAGGGSRPGAERRRRRRPRCWERAEDRVQPVPGPMRPPC